MTTGESSTRRERTIIYWTIAGLLAGFMIVGLLAWRSAEANQQAQEKADRLVAALNTAGTRTPSRDQVIRVLGDEGGAVCANPNESLRRATLLAHLANGSGGPGTRPVIADSRVIRGEQLVISIYCPDKLPAYQQFVNELNTADLTSV